jgi:hypothetical protein
MPQHSFGWLAIKIANDKNDSKRFQNRPVYCQNLVNKTDNDNLNKNSNGFRTFYLENFFPFVP